MDEEAKDQIDAYHQADYLSEEQLEAVRAKVQDSKTSADHLECLSMIDAFVRENGTSDVEYETLLHIVQSSLTADSEEMNYPNRIKFTIPMVFMISYLDFLMLTNVMSEDEIERMTVDAFRQGMNGGPAKA